MKKLSLREMENVQGGRFSDLACGGIAMLGILGAFAAPFTGGWSLIGTANAAITYSQNCNYESYAS